LHLDDTDGVGQALQEHFATGDELVLASTPRHHPDHLGGQDLPTGGVGAEPGGFYHRRAEAVAVRLDGDVADTQPHPNRQRRRSLRSGLPFEIPLDLSGRRDGIGGAPKGGQDAVPETLHDRSFPGCDRLGHQPVVNPPHLVGGLLSQTHPQLRRADDVGHENRGRLCRHREPVE
jgi:hypothetical protein